MSWRPLSSPALNPDWRSEPSQAFSLSVAPRESDTMRLASFLVESMRFFAGFRDSGSAWTVIALCEAAAIPHQQESYTLSPVKMSANAGRGFWNSLPVDNAERYTLAPIR